ncbi:MAG: transaldolase family protein, partial [Limibaculum sp.]
FASNAIGARATPGCFPRRFPFTAASTIPRSCSFSWTGATFVSPFIGRLDDIGLDGMELIADIRQIFDNYNFQTQILAASIRSVNHVATAAKLGADVATIPPGVVRKLADHPLTDKGLAAFLADWAKTGQKILS